MNASVNREYWLEQRHQLLRHEKAALRQLDEVARLRRAMPWVQITEPYEFETELGRQSLSDLFGPNSQLVVYHFMFGSGWDEGCLGCSFLCDHLDAANLHLAHHDVSLVVVSRAPLNELRQFKARMGWKFRWVSSHSCDFNFDFGVSFRPEEISSGSAYYNYAKTDQVMDEMQGLSVFTRDTEQKVYHTYSTYARGLDPLLGAHYLLDLTPKGRNEEGVMSWVRHHDMYGVQGAAHFPSRPEQLGTTHDPTSDTTSAGDES